MARRHSSSALVVCAALVVACLGISASAQAVGARSVSSSSALVTSATGATASGSEPDSLVPERPRPGRTRIVQVGPASPILPDIDSYYYALNHGQCAALRVRLAQPNDEVTALYSSLADLCLGAKSKAYKADWAAAQQAYDDSGALEDCLSLAARAALGRALSNHEDTGKAVPDFRPVPTGTACVPKPAFVGLLQNSADAPASLIVVGLRLFEVTGVRIDGVWHDAAYGNANNDCARVDVPGLAAPAPGTTVAIRLRGATFKTPTSQWTVAGPITDDDVQNVDSSTCLPPSADQSGAAAPPATSP